ncbi:C-type lectin lectoxin-Lei1-like isoform X2 [Paroedura picta]|uniref:C-type lectin lectoxin-Lei1-like isoform X2 n=1 Tax=Paroedura picta TaxID=143630 RepID=UPI004057B408
MDEEHQNEEYQNNVFTENFFATREMDSVHAKTEPEPADEEYENDNQEYEYIDFSNVRMRKLPEVGVKTDSDLLAFKSGQWRDIFKGPFIAFSFLLFLSVMLAIAALVLACLKCFATCPNGWEKLDEKCYNFSSEVTKWKEAQKQCQNAGANLVVINNEREREFLDYKMTQAYWIGLFYEEDKKSWKWVDDKNEFYSNWDRNVKPLIDGTTHSKICMVSDAGKHRNWNNIECQHRHSFICEKHSDASGSSLTSH